jgi:hypothetical protein
VLAAYETFSKLKKQEHPISVLAAYETFSKFPEKSTP